MGKSVGQDGQAAGTQAIGRTLDVLALFQERGRDLGISEIADDLRLSLGTAHRIVRALVDRGYLAQNRRTERYFLGRSAVLLGHAASAGLGLHRAQPVLDRVRDETGESVNLGVREGADMVVIVRAESRHPLRFSQEPGSRLPVHATAMGKVTLAHSGDLTVEVDHLPDPLRRLTTRTLTERSLLMDELETIRRRGYSVDNEEAVHGVRCLAAPILTPDGLPMAAVAIQGPTVRMSRRRVTSLASLVRATAEEVTALLPLTQYE